ncbi:hypothetical protein SDC9_187176 [bioreactor metagenome]|uniref:Uncharacterized protein n=1 Tax=bioreactor metagenome TaxID=1076179 RepID=A0A645HKX5_9ZZZZ
MLVSNPAGKIFSTALDRGESRSTGLSMVVVLKTTNHRMIEAITNSVDNDREGEIIFFSVIFMRL